MVPPNSLIIVYRIVCRLIVYPINVIETSSWRRSKNIGTNNVILCQMFNAHCAVTQCIVMQNGNVIFDDNNIIKHHAMESATHLLSSWNGLFQEDKRSLNDDDKILK